MGQFDTLKLLETRRLLLRHLEMNDLDDLYALYTDPEVTRYIPDAPGDLKGTRAELEWHVQCDPENPQLGLWATIHKPTGQFIGRCGLLPWSIDGRNEVEIAYLISRAFWGQGLGAEAAMAVRDYALNVLKINRLVCLVDAANHPSVRVAEKIGMSFEREGQDEFGPFRLYALNREGEE
jgi:ribosomal-protein-alanine N-acetyltransferase